ncbi:MAG TPA: META domain-containing protein [Chitinophagaceae bacterium]
MFEKLIYKEMKLAGTVLYAVQKIKQIMTMKYLFILIIAVSAFKCSPKLSPDAGWGHQQWVLVEMKGVPVQQSGGRKDAHITFDVATKKFSGNGGCNQVNGNYSLDKNEIRFTEVLSTKMSCSDIEFENTFLSILGSIDKYEIKGNDLLLKKKKEAMLVLRPKQASGLY